MGKGFYTDVALSSNDETWRTPRSLFDSLDEEFGFSLDAAALSSSALVPGNWFGPDHVDPVRRDCLTVNWLEYSGGGSVFMNPPYGRKIGLFMAKAASYSDLRVVCLVPARTDTAWFHDYVFDRGASVRFLRGRLKFNDGPNAAPFPSAIVIY